jgi:hypothetical protein
MLVNIIIIIIIIIINLRRQMGRACSTYGARRSAYRVLEGKPEGRRPLRRPRRRWEDIKMGLREVRWGHGLD